MNHGHKEYLICQEHNYYGLSKFPKYEENGTCPKCELEQLRAKVAELEFIAEQRAIQIEDQQVILEKYQNLEPVAYYTCQGNWPRIALAIDGNYDGYEIPLYALEMK